MRCETFNCGNVVTHRVYWPGQTINTCKACAERAAGASRALGFALTIEEIPYEPAREGESNKQSSQGEVY